MQTEPFLLTGSKNGNRASFDAAVFVVGNGGSLMERDQEKAESCDRRRMEEREVVYFQEFRECGFNTLQVKEIYPCG